MIITATGVALCAAATTVGATAFLLHRLPGWGFVDLPNERSFHAQAVPRGAGVGMAAVWVAVSAVVLARLGHLPDLLVVLGMAAALSGLGLLDDRSSLPPLIRLSAEVVICGLAAATGLGGTHLLLPGGAEIQLGLFAAPMWTVGLVTLVNFFNFMDGIDGLAAGQTLVSAAALAAFGTIGQLAGLTYLSAALAGVAAAFLLFNWSPARCFMGDAGSYFCGGTLGGLFLAGQQHGVSPVLSASPAAFFLLDALVTLLVRTARRRPLWRAHRDHLYQRMAARWSHAWVVSAYVSAAMLTGGIGLGVALRLTR